MLEILEIIKHSLSLYFVMPLIILSGLYFSLSLDFIQFKNIFYSISCAIKATKSNEKFSSFSALNAVLGGNLGTGNIAGIAVALATGGPGSLLWIIVMVLFGMAIRFCCCFLGVKYRQKINNNWVGGPMYYLAKGLNCKYLDKIFCILVICSAITTGNLIQINSITLPLHQINIPPLFISLATAILVALVIVGDLKRFSNVANKIVPFMAIFYIVSCIYVLFSYKNLLVPSLKLIFYTAFDIKSFSGAGLGFTLMQSIRVGFDRGIMATDTGVGIAPILHSQVSHSKAVDSILAAKQQGLVAMLAPLIVLSICILTGMVLLVTNVWQTSLKGTSMCLAAFKIALNNQLIATLVVNVTLFLFSFTTILTWWYCAECAMQYLCKHLTNNYLYIRFLKYAFITIIPLGGFLEIRTLWNLADLFLDLMVLINIYAICNLFKKITTDLKNN